MLKSSGEFLREFWKILGKYHILDIQSVGSKGLKIEPHSNAPRGLGIGIFHNATFHIVSVLVIGHSQM